MCPQCIELTYKVILNDAESLEIRIGILYDA